MTKLRRLIGSASVGDDPENGTCDLVATRVTALIERGADDLGVSLPADAAHRLARFLEVLQKWNRAQNLTSMTELEAMVAGHVLDSLSGAPWVRGARVLDVGTGAGLPGIPLAVAHPEKEYVLLDGRRKRIQFLLYVKQMLNLENVTVLQARFEKYQPDGKFDTLTARAFAAFPELVRLAMPFIMTGTRLVAWQGRDPSAESEKALADQPVRCAARAVRVPGIGAPRHIVVIEPRDPSLPRESSRTERGTR